MSDRSAKYHRVKDYFDKGLWNKEMVRNAAGRWITETEAEEIISGVRPEGGMTDL